MQLNINARLKLSWVLIGINEANSRMRDFRYTNPFYRYSNSVKISSSCLDLAKKLLWVPADSRRELLRSITAYSVGTMLFIVLQYAVK
jgi:hypothetical protein